MTRSGYRFKTFDRTVKAGEAVELGCGIGLIEFQAGTRVRITAPENSVRFVPLGPDPDATVKFPTARDVVEATEPVRLPAA